MLAMNPLDIGGIDLALNSQAISGSEEQGVCSQATGSGTLMKSLLKLMGKDITSGAQLIMKVRC